MSLITFPKGVTNLPTWAVGENAANAGQGAGNTLGLIASYNALLAEVQAIENSILDSPPASPSAFDDEFTGTTLNPKWTLSTVPSNFTAGLVAPTWLGMSSFSTPAGLVTATEAVTTASGFMFQIRCKFALVCSPNTNTAPYAQFGLTVGSKSFGVRLGGGGVSAIVPLLTLLNGNSFASTIQSTDYETSGDMRFRIGLQSGNLLLLMSFDGFNWMTVYTESFNGAGTSFNGSFPTALQLSLQQQGSATNASMVAWDYVRKIN